MARKICLSGFAELSREYANRQPEGTEIWGMNEGHSFLKKSPDRWFQIHPRFWNQKKMEQKGWPADNYGRHPAHLEWLSKQTCPVYMKDVDERVATSVRYPLETIVGKYGRYLTSTIAYMLALVLYEHEQYRWWKPWAWKKKVESVTMTGIELALGTEYMIQRPCVEYFIGRLQGAGIKFHSPPVGSSVLQGPLYAVDHDRPVLEGDLKPIWSGSEIKRKDLPVVDITEPDLEAVGA